MMSRPAKKTTIRLGSVFIDVNLFRTSGDPPKPSLPFVTASPAGNPVVSKSGAQVFMGSAGAVVSDPLGVSGAGGGGTATFQNVDSWTEDTVTGERVEPDEIRRGVRTETGDFIDLTDQLAAIQEMSMMDEMAIFAFIDAKRVPRERVIGSYWLAPQGEGGIRALALILHGMKETGRVALVKWTKTSKQALGVITPHRSGALLVQELAFFSSARQPPEAALRPSLEMDHLTADQEDVMQRLIRGRADVPVLIDEMEDDALVAKLKLVEDAEAGRVAEVEELEVLMDEDFLEAFANSVPEAE
jgi:non-homologous end joining protein Ku